MAIDQQETIQKTAIRTMKKDLARLREADATKESRKILDLGTVKKDPEAQKQQIFLMEKQKSTLENELKAVEKEVDKVVMPSNNPAKQKQLEQSLSSVIDRQEKEPDEIKKETLEKQRWMVEKKLADVQKNIVNVEAKRTELSQKKEEITASVASLSEGVKKIEAEAPPKPAQPTTPPREKLMETATAENEQRRKFMEDIEKWANAN